MSANTIGKRLFVEPRLRQIVDDADDPPVLDMVR